MPKNYGMTDTEAASRSERRWAAAVLDALPSAVLLVDPALVVLELNDHARALLQLEQDPVGRATQALLSRAEDGPLDAAAAAASAGRPWVLDADIPSPDGPPRPVRLHGAPLRPDGRLAGAVVTLEPQPSHRTIRLPGGGSSISISDELSEALRGDQIVLHYQPIVRLQDSRPVAAEALVRWEHPRRGLLRPAEFLATADTAALAERLGTRVLRQACHAAAAWARSMKSTPGVRVAVNLSQRQLLQAGTSTLVRDALAVAQCPPEQLLLEVPEDALLRDPESAVHALKALKDVGVGIAIDDLGTGSSALSYLKRFPVDMVKIDRSLIAGLGQDPEQSAVVASLVSMAQAIGVPCVAEGVETADQLRVLRRLECDFAQGYLFSRPMNEQSATQWLVRALPTRSRATPRTTPAVAPEAVQRALELQAEGASLHTLAARLNAEGHRNVGGRRWHHTSVAQLIAAHKFPDLV